MSLFKRKGKTIRAKAVEELYHLVKDYSEWYDEHGMALPPDYATDPSRWTVDLQKIKKSFKLLYDESRSKGELYELRSKWKKFGEVDMEKIKDLEEEIRIGLSIFGAQLFYLNDNRSNKPGSNGR